MSRWPSCTMVVSRPRRRTHHSTGLREKPRRPANSNVRAHQMPRTPNSSFDAIDWMVGRQPGLARYLRFDPQPLLHFALMWNMFEAEVCDCSASVTKLRTVANTLASRDFAGHPQAVSFLTFLRERYWAKTGPTDYMFGLRFRTEEERCLVSEVLSAQKPSPPESIFAQLLVVYRYRNNTFHGLKSIAEIFGSSILFDQSARFLAAALEAG